MPASVRSRGRRRRKQRTGDVAGIGGGEKRDRRRRRVIGRGEPAERNRSTQHLFVDPVVEVVPAIGGQLLALTIGQYGSQEYRVHADSLRGQLPGEVDHNVGLGGPQRAHDALFVVGRDGQDATDDHDPRIHRSPQVFQRCADHGGHRCELVEALVEPDLRARIENAAGYAGPGVGDDDIQASHQVGSRGDRGHRDVDVSGIRHDE